MTTKKTYIYRDMVSGCEMFSVAHPHALMDGNDAVVCVQSAMIKENGDAIDVGGGDHFGGGGDAEPLDDGEIVVNNVIATAGLVEVAFKKKVRLLARGAAAFTRQTDWPN